MKKRGEESCGALYQSISASLNQWRRVSLLCLKLIIFGGSGTALASRRQSLGRRGALALGAARKRRGLWRRRLARSGGSARRPCNMARLAII